MPIKYTIIKDRGLIVSIHTGSVPDKEFIDSYTKLFSDPEFDLGYNLLIDLRQAESVNRSSAALHTIASMVKARYQGSKQQPKTAIIASSDLSYGLSRMYQAYSDAVSGESSVFRNLDEALEWLGVPTGAIDHILKSE
ncbi:MAG: hypothetical protein JXB45_04100 [Candidatus Krumholzibacteriota bacterium]|nr:hypothetical protein [Candidatus Krumholzibacteriota bacterium]